jgi:DNA invertase Pin-like site-specific DNA recombinase
MNGERDQKVTANHLARDAYLYVRRATLGQGYENAEAIQRQYNLRQQAVALGWPVEKVIVIDGDVGKSGASQAHRPGFQMLLREIELGRVGIVLALEPSRLARNSSDWQRLLGACMLNDTILLDQDGLFHPADFQDRVLLGCEETMPRTTEYCPSVKETWV